MPENIVPFLVPGRFIRVLQSENTSSDENDNTATTTADGKLDWGWGVVIAFQKQRINPKKFVMGDSKNKGYLDVIAKTETHYLIDVLLYVKNKLTSDNVLQPGDLIKKDGRLGVVPVLLHHSNIGGISTI